MFEPNGLYYMRARYYDSSVGRFISEDPSGFAGGDVNLYAYCNNNPINQVDPSGLCRSSSIYGSAWTSGRGSTTPWWTPTPERALRWTGKILQEAGYRLSGRALSIFGAAIEPAGTGKLIGMAIGGTIGGGLGSSAGPAGAVAGAMLGGAIGGDAGSMFDYPGSGQLNYREWDD